MPRSTYLASSIAGVILMGMARGQTWIGTASGNWNTAGNLSPAGVPTNSSTAKQLTFVATPNATMINNIPGTFTLNRMTFSAGDPAYSLMGNGLHFQSTNGSVLPSITLNSANAVGIANSVTLTNNLTVGESGIGTIIFSGSLNTTTGTMTYGGAGTLVLSGSTHNNNPGLTVNSGTAILAKTSLSSPNMHAIGGFGLIINGGAVQLGGNGGDQIYDGANVTVNNSGVFDANGNSEAFAVLNLQGLGPAGGNGALVNIAVGLRSHVVSKENVCEF